MTVSAAQRADARERARALLHRAGVTAPPVPVERVAKLLGVSIRYAPLEDELSGMAFVKGEAKVVAVNALHHPNRQRFTIAHELGHHVLHADRLASGVHVDRVIMRRDQISSQGSEDFEIQANVFASELLMPRDLIASETGASLDLNDEVALAALARRFKVSPAALQFRLAAME